MMPTPNQNEKTEMAPQDIVEFRARYNLTQKGLASLLGVSWQAVQFWENNERKIPQTTIRLIRLFKKYPQLVTEF